MGDLHGCFDLLLNALTHVEFNELTDRLFSVGDMVDRGDKNLECLELLNQDWFFAIPGNHEHLMLDYFDEIPFGRMWGPNGGCWHEDFTDEQFKSLDRLVDKVRELPLFMTVMMADGSRFHLVHAELNHLKPLSDTDLEDENIAAKAILEPTLDGVPSGTWGRSLFRPLVFRKIDTNLAIHHRSNVDFYKLDAHMGPNMSQMFTGHTVVQQPTRITKHVNLDTGAFLTQFADENRAWAGLTLTEPATGKFWKTNKQGTQEVALVEV